jgi:hypothetical protein
MQYMCTEDSESCPLMGEGMAGFWKHSAKWRKEQKLGCTYMEVSKGRNKVFCCVK